MSAGVTAPLFSRERELRAFVHRFPEPPDRDRVTGPLSGHAVAVKDNVAVRGAPYACGSATRRGLGPATADAEVVRRIRAAGGWVCGTTNLDELAMGASTETSAYGVTRNPWDPDRVPGGSSGGTAAAVAAYGVLGVGTDTGGSIREPAAMCGVVGVAPSPGTVPTDGVLDFAPTMDRVGPMAPTVAGAALLHEVLAGTTGLVAAARRGSAAPELAGRTVGWVVPMSGDRNAPEVRRRLEETCARLADAGARLVPVEVPRFGDLLDTYVALSSVEALPVLREHAALGPLGIEATRRLALAEDLAGSPAYEEALATRARMAEDVARAFSVCEVMLSPTMPLVAPLFGRTGMGNPTERPRTDWWTVEANLAGLPAISVPAGLGEGLPVGVQLMAPAGRDDLLYELGGALEASLPTGLAEVGDPA